MPFLEYLKPWLVLLVLCAGTLNPLSAQPLEPEELDDVLPDEWLTDEPVAPAPKNISEPTVPQKQSTLPLKSKQPGVQPTQSQARVLTFNAFIENDSTIKAGHALYTLDQQYTYTPIHITDTLLVRKMSEDVLAASFPLNGYLEFSLSFNNPKQIVLTQDGTEICRISARYTKIFLKQNPAFFRKSPLESVMEEDAISSQTVKDLFTVDRVLQYGRWQTGVNLDYGYEVERDHQKFFWYKAHLKLSVLHPINMFYVGGSLSLQDYEGDMFGPQYSFVFMDTLRMRYGNKYEKYGYSFRAGLNFIQYELHYDPWPIPNYYWLEVEQSFRKSEYYQAREDLNDTANIFMRPFSEIHTSKLSGNYSHNIYLMFGKFRYHFLYDDDLYQFPIHEFSVEDLPAFWGTWGMGVTNSTYIWVPHIYIETDNSTAFSVKIKNYDIDIYTPKLKLSLIYHSNEYYLVRANFNFYFNYLRTQGGDQ